MVEFRKLNVVQEDDLIKSPPTDKLQKGHSWHKRRFALVKLSEGQSQVTGISVKGHTTLDTQFYLMYWKDVNDRKKGKKPIRIIPIGPEADIVMTSHPFLPKDFPHVLALVTSERTFYLCAKDETQRRQWFQAVKSIRGDNSPGGYEVQQQDHIYIELNMDYEGQSFSSVSTTVPDGHPESSRENSTPNSQTWKLVTLPIDKRDSGNSTSTGSFSSGVSNYEDDCIYEDMSGNLPHDQQGSDGIQEQASKILKIPSVNIQPDLPNSWVRSDLPEMKRLRFYDLFIDIPAKSQINITDKTLTISTVTNEWRIESIR